MLKKINSIKPLKIKFAESMKFIESPVNLYNQPQRLLKILNLKILKIQDRKNYLSNEV
jgi:hypothetical protein